MDFHEEIRRNRVRLRVALGVYFLLALAAGYLTGWAFLFVVDPEAYYGLGEAAAHDVGALGGLTSLGYVHQVTIAILLLAWVNYRRMARCGDRIVLSLAGARPLRERQFLNAGEEMAVAAGMPAPRFWIIETPDLNAFACHSAGRRPSVALTRGLLDELSRDELQAVVAHEIAHIRNGDARLMTMLLGLGRTFHLISYFALGPLRLLFDAGIYGWEQEAEAGGEDAEEPSSDRASSFWERPATPRGVAIAAAVLPVLILLLMAAGVVLSLGMMAVFALVLSWFPWLVAAYAAVELLRQWKPGLDGWIESRLVRHSWLAVLLLFLPGGLIVGPAMPVLGIIVPTMLLLTRLQVSRNREFQADAVAVELTRNPGALRGALETIRDARASISPKPAVPRALSPLTIVSTGRGWSEQPALGWLRAIVSTHPPLEARIARLARMERVAGAPVTL